MTTTGWTPRGETAAGSDELLGIGAFARRARLSQKALRIYERLDLLAPAEVDDATGYRRYRESQLPAARLVALLRRLDMPLAEIREIVTAPPELAERRIAAWWAAAEERHASHRELVAHLCIRLAGERSIDMTQVQEREVPEQLVLTEQRHVAVEKLGSWLPEAIGRLAATAESVGGMTAPVFVVYHGEVNQDSDGPVEVCVPVAREVPDAATRVEPAHREAYVRLRKSQVEFPQILTAYDAVAAWVREHGRSTTVCAPREVYFNDFDAAGPDDEVCEVAFPID